MNQAFETDIQEVEAIVAPAYNGWHRDEYGWYYSTYID